ncbi:hypothetical protein [Pseudoalteromonas phenolica]
MTKLLLKQRYPDFSDKELKIAWAANVEVGLSDIRNGNNLNNFIYQI